MRINNLLKIIEFQEDCRGTHINYIDFYKKYPKEEKLREKIAGDTKHHQACIDGYNITLELLYNLREKKQ